MLAKYEVHRDKLRGNLRLFCKDCEEPTCIGRTYRSPPLRYKYWPACPEYLRALPDWQHVIEMSNAIALSPVAGWPYDQPCWLFDGVNDLSNANAEKMRAKLKN